MNKNDNLDTVSTPRTDDFLRTKMVQCETYNCFARTLERELAAKDREIARLNKCINVDTPKMLALNAEILARAEKAEAELREAKLLCVRQLLTIQELRAELESAQAALAAAKLDTERLDWLIAGNAVRVPDGPGHYTCRLHYRFDRAAIDAAREGT